MKAVRLLVVSVCAGAWAFVCRAADVLVPRMITEDVALVHTSKGYEVVCSMKDVRPYESFHAVGRVRSFNLLGQGLCPRMVGKVRPWARARQRKG